MRNGSSLIVVIALACVSPNSVKALGRDMVSVPNVMSMSESEAAQVLQSVGLSFATSQLPHLGVEVGSVGGQIPIGGAEVDPRHSVVFLSLSTEKGIAVPKLVGSSIQKAGEDLKAAGLSMHLPKGSPRLILSGGMCGPTTYYKATVVSASPAEGVFLFKGSTVEVTYKVTPESTEPGPPCNKDKTRVL